MISNTPNLGYDCPFFHLRIIELTLLRYLQGSTGEECFSKTLR